MWVLLSNTLIPLKAVQIRHGNPAEHGADDTEEALVGAGEVEILQMSAAVLDLIWRTVDRAVQMAGVFAHRAGREHVVRKPMLIQEGCGGRLRRAVSTFWLRQETQSHFL